jgi:hypothetical protein
MTESPNVICDGRGDILLTGVGYLAIQVEEPACDGERQLAVLRRKVRGRIHLTESAVPQIHRDTAQLNYEPVA